LFGLNSECNEGEEAMEKSVNGGRMTEDTPLTIDMNELGK